MSARKVYLMNCVHKEELDLHLTISDEQRYLLCDLLSLILSEMKIFLIPFALRPKVKI